MKKVTIIGINGGFGRLFYSRLIHEQVEVIGIDIHRQAFRESNLQYFQADISNINNSVIARLKESDCLLFCLPESVLLHVYTSILEKLNPGTLVIDTLSVKSSVVRLGAIRDDLEILSLNPLFAPDLGFPNQNVMAVSLNSASHTDDFIGYLRKWGARVSILSAEAHDQLTAITQVTTHFSLLCFGATLKKLHYRPEAAFFTPVHEMLLSLLGRMISQNPQVYWKIQTDNPYGEIARKLFMESAKEWQEKIFSGDEEAFNDQFNGIGQITTDMLDRLMQKFFIHQTD